MSEAIFDVVKGVLVKIRGIDEAEVVPEAVLVDDLGADSLDAIEIIMALEEHYGKELDDVEVEDLKTVADVVNLIQSLIE
ncbi:MAG: acyl carrier protein [Coriobacteriia bacterium]|nr:acyl carrier protein [Coriobacteriia bacterium]MCL2750033.1 acyl carrier protein [Coriobacteriia bacterium]